jgi:hypothetical protein
VTIILDFGKDADGLFIHPNLPPLDRSICKDIFDEMLAVVAVQNEMTVHPCPGLESLR